MSGTGAMLGARLRQVRKRAGRSLADVAGHASMSISTLSRIETGKQPLEVETLIRLAGILGVDPASVITSADDAIDPVGPLIRQFRVLDRTERLRLWAELTEGARRGEGRGSRRGSELAIEIDELLAQVELLRAEIESVRSRLD